MGTACTTHKDHTEHFKDFLDQRFSGLFEKDILKEGRRKDINLYLSSNNSFL